MGGLLSVVEVLKSPDLNELSIDHEYEIVENTCGIDVVNDNSIIDLVNNNSIIDLVNNDNIIIKSNILVNKESKFISKKLGSSRYIRDMNVGSTSNTRSLVRNRVSLLPIYEKHHILHKRHKFNKTNVSRKKK
jgi:hypothetical protein